MSEPSDAALDTLEERLGIRFRDRSLLRQALTHRSYRPAEDGRPAASNERLEFLGDATLNGVVASHLYRTHGEWSKGELTRARAAAVSRQTLAQVGGSLGLGEFMLLGKGQARTGRLSTSLLADAVEAVIGAAFIEMAGAHRHRYVAEAMVRMVFEPLLAMLARAQPEVECGPVLGEIQQEAARAGPRPPISGPPADDDAVAAIEARLGYRFPDRDLLKQALTRASYARGAGQPSASHDALVFLGDALLNMAVTMHLHFMRPESAASDLSRLRATAVSDPLLAQIGRDLGLGEFILMGTSEERSDGRERPSVLVDAIKALIAAAVLTVGMDPGRLAFRTFVLRLLGPWLEAIERDPGRVDPKTLLQELSHRAGTTTSYHVVEASGPDHDRTFVVEARVGKDVAGTGRGSNKKEAEQEAAKQALASEARQQAEGGASEGEA